MHLLGLPWEGEAVAHVCSSGKVGEAMISDPAPAAYRYARIGKYQVQAHIATGEIGRAHV